MTKEEKQKEIMKIEDLEMRLFSVLDENYPDGRTIRNIESAIYKRLDKLTDDKVLKEKIRLVIQREMWNMEDFTFKPIFDGIRNLGVDI